MSKGFASSYRTGLLALGLVVCFAGVGARLVWLHVVNRDELLRFVTRARQSVERVPARRGDILDRRGTVLATSRTLNLVKVSPGVLRDKDRPKWPQLARLLEMPLPEVEKILTTKFRAAAPAKSAAPTPGLVFNLNLPSVDAGDSAAPVAATAPAAATDANSIEPETAADKNGRREIVWAKLAENVSESTYREIEKLDIRGIGHDRVYQRTYPHNELGAHVIGFVNRAQVPVTGIESFADFYLRGQDGWFEGERDGRRRELAQFRTRDVPRADGYNVKLSLDTNVQDMIDQELAYIAQKYQPLKATIIVSDPRDGFILGMGNYPSFDPNKYNEVPASEQARMKNVQVTR